MKDDHAVSIPEQGTRGRKINLYEKTDAGLRSKVLKMGVSKSSGAPLERRLLVTGTGRCGTTWLSRMFMQAGLDIPHEYVGNLGTVSMYLQTDHDWYPFIPWNTGDEFNKVAHVGERRSDYRFQHIVHLVRHPLEVAVSMQGIINEVTYEWFTDSGISEISHKMRPALKRNLIYWRDMVKNCEAQADQTIDLHRFNEKHWYSILEAANLPSVKMPELPPTNKSSGFKKGEPIFWEDVKAMDKELHDELRQMTRELDLWQRI